MEFKFEDISRRSWRNRAREGFRFQNDTTCIFRRSRTVPSLIDTNQLTIELGDLYPPELFNNGTKIIATGGYIKTPADAEYSLELSLGDVTESTTGELSPEKWEDIGIHAEPSEPAPSDGYSATVDLYIDGVEGDIEEFQIYGLNIAPVTFQYFRENIEYEDGVTVKKKFYNSVSSGVFSHQLYYLDHEEPMPLTPSNYSRDDFEQGDVVVLRKCSRRGGRFLPVEYEREKSNDRKFKISYSTHCNDGCDHGDEAFPMVNKFEVLTEQSTVDLDNLPDKLDELVYETDPSQSREGDIVEGEVEDTSEIILDLHFGNQAECRACKKFEVNDEGNPKRTTAQHNEAKDKRSVKEFIAYKELGRSPYDKKFNRNNDQTFRNFIWERFSRRCFNCGKKLSNPDSDGSLMHLDHTLPASKLYPLDKYATCLCNDCNRDKEDRYPVEYYPDREKREKLSEVTGIDVSRLEIEQPNIMVLKSLVESPENLFEGYLNHDVCKREYNGTLIADKIVSDINDLLEEAKMDVRIEREYRRKTGKNPVEQYRSY